MSPIPPFGEQVTATKTGTIVFSGISAGVALSGLVIPMPAENTFPSNDRTWFAEQQAAQQQEQRAEEELRHYEVMGAGMAVFCLSFWQALRDAEPANTVRFTHGETLRLLEAALRGR